MWAHGPLAVLSVRLRDEHPVLPERNEDSHISQPVYDAADLDCVAEQVEEAYPRDGEAALACAVFVVRPVVFYRVQHCQALAVGLYLALLVFSRQIGPEIRELHLFYGHVPVYVGEGRGRAVLVDLWLPAHIVHVRLVGYLFLRRLFDELVR